MERTVPQIVSEEIELYLRTYYSLLRSSSEVKIRSLEEAHAGMNSLLHASARGQAPDMSAFIYSILRLPDVLSDVSLVVLGQTSEVFTQAGIGDIEAWQPVEARARRRPCFYDGEKTLACMIASRSDIDDIIPLLTAYQIEWNKLHKMLRRLGKPEEIEKMLGSIDGRTNLAGELQLDLEDLQRLETIWGDDFVKMIKMIAARSCRMEVRLLNGSLAEYRRAIYSWWQRIEAACPGIIHRPLYFISSNAHSLINILTGFALRYEDELIEYVEKSGDPLLQGEWEAICGDEVPSSRENFLYYVLKKYMNTPAGRPLKAARLELEKACEIVRIPSQHSFDIEAQIVPLNKLNLELIDPRVKGVVGDDLAGSDAVIMNIDYPLGMAAYHLMAEVSEHFRQVLGVYVMGKAATLNGAVGDVMLPNVVYDGHSKNTYLFKNCFSATDVAPYLVYGSVLDSQKAVTVQGTFLQNYDYMDVFYREGYTDIEMEGGPYLSAVYEMVRPKRHPYNEIVDLHQAPFDMGILHYASDKPLSKGKNLGAASLSYFGMDPTYATSIAILRRIFEVERSRLNTK